MPFLKKNHFIFAVALFRFFGQPYRCFLPCRLPFSSRFLAFPRASSRFLAFLRVLSLSRSFLAFLRVFSIFSAFFSGSGMAPTSEFRVMAGVLAWTTFLFLTIRPLHTAVQAHPYWERRRAHMDAAQSRKNGANPMNEA